MTQFHEPTLVENFQFHISEGPQDFFGFEDQSFLPDNFSWLFAASNKGPQDLITSGSEAGDARTDASSQCRSNPTSPLSPATQFSNEFPFPAIMTYEDIIYDPMSHPSQYRPQPVARHESFHQSRPTTMLNQTFAKSGRFTQREDGIIVEAVHEFESLWGKGPNPASYPIWSMIGAKLYRTAVQCRIRYSESLAESVKRGHWTVEEDMALQAGIIRHDHSWSRIASMIPGRTQR